MFSILQPRLTQQASADRFGDLLGLLARFVVWREPPAPRAVSALCIVSCIRARLIYGTCDHAPGLASFTEAYRCFAGTQKSSRATRDEYRELARATLERFAEDGACAVELRPTFERRPLELHRRLWAILDGYVDFLSHASQPLALGLVLSLYKQEKPNGEEDAAAQGRVWADQVETLLKLLDVDPVLRWFVVGIDAAGQERGCPPRALIPAFERLQHWHECHGLSRGRPGVDLTVTQLQNEAQRLNPEGKQLHPKSREVLHSLPEHRWFRLGRSVHAGEDFADPITGLRHIHETLTVLDFRCGDRLGHALAAALDEELLSEFLATRSAAPELTGVRRLPDGSWRICKPVGVHMLDLAFVAELLDDDSSGHELQAVLGRAWSDPTALDRAVRQLRPVEAVARLGVPNLSFENSEPLDPEGGLWVRFDPERFEDVRQHVLRELIVRDIVIESCPTSNRVVTGLHSAPVQKLVQVAGLGVVVATDDPGLFDAWPCGELAQVPSPSHRDRVLEVARAASFVRRA